MPHHDQRGQDEDDGRQRAGRRGLRLHHVVFKDVGVLEQAQHRHRNHRRGNGGRERQADLQPQEDVGGREDHGDQGAEQDAAERQFRKGDVCRDADGLCH
ncbi:hypothetical protein G6F65_022001 [Rhizopus arrhizus]|nr:hypothetical protein G6F65_022001 [Rhizopus arrhizus]